jgi:hypothetical protein
MYNLGVFYVHGWGGVPVDCNRARQLFVAAAELGQTNAQEALSLVPPPSDDSMGNFILLIKFQEQADPTLQSEICVACCIVCLTICASNKSPLLTLKTFTELIQE